MFLTQVGQSGVTRWQPSSLNIRSLLCIICLVVNFSNKIRYAFSSRNLHWFGLSSRWWSLMHTKLSGWLSWWLDFCCELFIFSIKVSLSMISWMSRQRWSEVWCVTICWSINGCLFRRVNSIQHSWFRLTYLSLIAWLREMSDISALLNVETIVWNDLFRCCIRLSEISA